MNANWQGLERQGAAAPTDFSRPLQIPPQPVVPPEENATEPDPIAAAGEPDEPVNRIDQDGPQPLRGVAPSPGTASYDPQPAENHQHLVAGSTAENHPDHLEGNSSEMPPAFRGRRAAQLQAKATSAALAPPTQGWRAFLRSITFGAIKPKVGSAELLLREYIAATQRQFSGTKTIVIANPKGGIGKTTCTVCIGGTFGNFRGGGVVTVDANESYGTLDVRTMSNGGTKTIIDLLENIGQFDRVDARVGELGGYWRAQPNAFFDVLVSDQDPARMEELGAEEFNRVHALLSRFRELIIVDTGNNIRRPNFLASIDKCDQLVIPTNLGHDSIRAVSLMIDQLDDLGRSDLVHNAICVVTGPGGEGQEPVITKNYLDSLNSWFRAVVRIPHDAHIGQKSIIDYHLLDRATRNAFLEVTALIAEGLTKTTSQSYPYTTNGEHQ